MKAVYKETEGAYTACLTERPVPTLTKQDNVLIRVHACTTCGLDMHIWQGKLRDCRPPIIMGHEFVGTIVKAVGESLGFSVGERVICQPHLYACGHCEVCRLGYPQFCRSRRSLGIQRDEEQPAYKHIILQPRIGGTFSFIRGHYDSAYGRIESGWQIQKKGYIYEATIPANTTATLYLPAKSEKSVRMEKGQEGITPVGLKDGKAVYRLGSGSYWIYVD